MRSFRLACSPARIIFNAVSRPRLSCSRLVHDPHRATAQLARGPRSPGPGPGDASRAAHSEPAGPVRLLARLRPGRRAPVRVREGLLQAVEERRVEVEPPDGRLHRPCPGPGDRARDQVVERALARGTLLDVAQRSSSSRSSSGPARNRSRVARGGQSGMASFPFREMTPVGWP